MDDVRNNQQLLEEVGLSALEAEIYLQLLTGGARGVAAIAETSGRPRSSIYAALRSLSDQGLVEGGAGYGSRYRAVPAADAVSALLAHEREVRATREELIQRMQPLLEELAIEEEEPGEEIIEVLRSRQAISERFERLQLEAESEIDVLAKGPAMGTRAGNPAQFRALKRGVRIRSLYQEGVLDSPDVAPHLNAWAAAGEEVRVFPGELPLKVAIFDRQRVLIPLEATKGGDRGMALLIRHPSLGLALYLLFEHLWEQGREPSPEDAGPTLAASGLGNRR